MKQGFGKKISNFTKRSARNVGQYFKSFGQGFKYSATGRMKAGFGNPYRSNGNAGQYRAAKTGFATGVKTGDLFFRKLPAGVKWITRNIVKYGKNTFKVIGTKGGYILRRIDDAYMKAAEKITPQPKQTIFNKSAKAQARAKANRQRAVRKNATRMEIATIGLATYGISKAADITAGRSDSEEK